MARVCTQLFALVPSIICTQVHDVDISEAVNLYAEDLPTPGLVSEELQRWKLQFTSQQTDLPSSCAQAIKQCDRASFPNVYTLLKLACTIPVTSCECERSVSALRRLQTYTRCTMGQERLSALAQMHMHYDVPVDLDNTVSLFSDMFPRRLQLQSVLL